MPMLIDRSQLLDASGNAINPVEDETVVLLRRIVKLLEPSGTQDSAQRQKVAIDAITSGLVLSTISSVTALGTVTTAGNLTGLGGVDPRWQFVEAARANFANGIRPNLVWA